VNGREARQAAAAALVSNAVYFAALAAVVVLVARRDWLVRQWMRLEAWRDRHVTAADAEVAELRRAISAYEHGAVP
jgi:hypothetical protein